MKVFFVYNRDKQETVYVTAHSSWRAYNAALNYFNLSMVTQLDIIELPIDNNITDQLSAALFRHINADNTVFTECYNDWRSAALYAVFKSEIDKVLYK